MKIEYTLTATLRSKLKRPFGNLIEGTVNETMDKLNKLIEKDKPSFIITVGDVVSRNVHLFCVHPQISIIDTFSLRNQKEPPLEVQAQQIVKVKNPPSVITEEAIRSIKKAISEKRHRHIVVDGEEDLLTLIAVLYAPINAFVIYGQPHCGIVVVKVDPGKKGEVKGFLKEMKITKS
jgi:uncharacterized protein (UPF0218 family)